MEIGVGCDQGLAFLSTGDLRVVQAQKIDLRSHVGAVALEEVQQTEDFWVIGYSQLALMQNPSEGRVDITYLEKMQKAGERGAQLTR